MNERTYNYLDQYINRIQATGRLSFSLMELVKEYSSQSEDALKLALNRLTKKEKIVSVYKGFYVIIPPEYKHRKILPPELFIDALFKYLGRPYYTGLLSAAVLHGASHQQAMESYVLINKPPIRATKIEGLKINYIVKSVMPRFGIEKKKTDAGYINISTAELTAIDLVEYQNRVGGLNRVATVLYELSDSINQSMLIEVLKNDISLSTLQRLGYILEIVLEKKDLADVIKGFLIKKKIFRVPLKTDEKKEGYSVHPGWKVIENYKIETDFL